MQINKYFIYNKFPYTCIENLLRPFTDNNEKWYIKRLNDEWENEMEFNELPKNIWLTNSLVVDKLNYIPQLLPKITVFDIKELALTSIDCQTLRLSDLKILTSNGFNKILRFFLHKIIILDTNDEIVPLVDVLELVPNVTYLILSFKYIQTSAKIIPKLILSKLQRLILVKVPDLFDFETLLNALKEKPDLYVKLKFKSSLSNQYTNKLINFVKKIIGAGLTEYFPPRLDFHGLTLESYNALKMLRKRYKECIQQRIDGTQKKDAIFWTFLKYDYVCMYAKNDPT